MQTPSERCDTHQSHAPLLDNELYIYIGPASGKKHNIVINDHTLGLVGACTQSHSAQQTTTSLHHRPNFRPLDFPSLFARPFSISSWRSLGVGGTSSASLERPRRDDPLEFLNESGNSVLRGVRAATTLRLDLLIVSRTVHSRFLAIKKRVAVETLKFVSISSTKTCTFLRALLTANQCHNGHDDDDSNHTTC